MYLIIGKKADADKSAESGKILRPCPLIRHILLPRTQTIFPRERKTGHKNVPLNGRREYILQESIL